MLYIFHVDTGTMLSVEMNLALEDGNTLKEAIKKITGIPGDKQVLLASGGETLEAKVRVCTYSAGTDTNPIYLFSKEAIDSSTPPTASVDHVPNADLNEEVDSSLNLPPTIGTVTMRCQLAQQIWELAKVLCRVCEKLVHDQHLQQQGWAAVIANLEDVTADFANRSEAFELNYKQYLETRPDFLLMLESFNNDIALLSKIPILPGLLEGDEESGEEGGGGDSSRGQELGGGEPGLQQEEVAGAAGLQQEEVAGAAGLQQEEVAGAAGLQQQKTLLQWISEKDRQYSVDEVAEHCRKGLDQFNEGVLEELKNEVKATLDIANKCEYREIKGLEDRLYGLDQLKTETVKILQEQTDLAQAFLQNQLRASNLGDASILPDLCSSHKRQLVVMHKNHTQLRDIKRRCLKAKQELVTNLHHRLKWVMFIESKINEMEMKLMMYSECLKRLRRQLTVLQQLHLAASAYMSAVSEVVRRRAFSQAFLLWANDLACQLCAVHSEEVARRKNFHSQFDGHFLSSLFPGLEDLPPPFATQPPQVFDDALPKLRSEDIERLRSELPELALSLSVPDTSSLTQFFLSRSANILKPEPLSVPSASIEERIVEVVAAAGLSSNLDPALLSGGVPVGAAAGDSSTVSVATNTQPISSDRGFESETDTEEFEKVGQSPCDIATKFQAQEKATKEEYLSRMSKVNSAVGGLMSELKTDVGQLKQWILCERTELECLISQLQEAYAAQNLRLRQELEEKEEALQKLAENQIKLEIEMRSCQEEREKALDELGGRQRREAAAQAEAEEAARREADRRAHQSPRQAIRSISESQLGSVEEIDEGDSSFPLCLLSSELTFSGDQTIVREYEGFRHLLVTEEPSKALLLTDSLRRLLVDKRGSETVRAPSIDADFSRSEILASSLSDKSFDSLLIKVFDKPERLRSELTKSSSPKSIHNVSPSSSIVTIEGTPSSLRDAATSPEPSPRKSRVSKEKLSESTNSLIQQGKISVGSCNEGDIVLVIWDENFGTYTILQESSCYTYFLHLDSLCSLGLRDNQKERGPKSKIIYTNPRKQYVIGEVVNKEFCQAKKAENRYNVPVGSRFYRVKVRPLSAAKPPAPTTISTGVQSSS